MFYYKVLDENGEIMQLESRSVQAVDAPHMIEIGFDEYNDLLTKMLANIEDEEVIESIEDTTLPYEEFEV